MSSQIFGWLKIFIDIKRLKKKVSEVLQLIKTEEFDQAELISKVSKVQDEIITLEKNLRDFDSSN